MQSASTSVEEYLQNLPEDRRADVAAVRAAILQRLPEGYREGMAYGMIGYCVPHEIYPAGYHCDPRQPLPFAGLAAQKNHIGVYLFCLYQDPTLLEWFTQAWKATGKRLDMGKSCVRFRRASDAALDVLGEAVARVPVEAFVRTYESVFAAAAARTKAGRAAPRGASTEEKSIRKTAATKKAPVKKKATATAAPKAAAPKKTAPKTKTNASAGRAKPARSRGRG